MRIILHVDMNSYFASVEQQDNPAWRGHPVGVCEHLGGIIIAASVEAKRWGIGTATPVWEAQALYPKIFLTKTHPDRYRYYTKKFVDMLEDYTDKVELYSIDEAFLDITKAATGRAVRRGKLVTLDPWKEASLIGLEIKKRIKLEVGDWLRCSVGIGWNKLTAKIASDAQKPDGLTVFKPDEKEYWYRKLELIDIPGIGRRQLKNLQALGINNVKDLSEFPKENLVARFGIGGWHLWNMGKFEGSWKEGFTEDPIKSMGHVYTLAREHRKPGNLFPVLSKLSDMVARRLRTAELHGSSIMSFIRAEGDVSLGGSRRLYFKTSDGKEIFAEARKLLLDQANSNLNFFETTTPYQVAVTVGTLTGIAPQQSIFPKYERRKRLLTALDKVTAKYGEEALVPLRGFFARKAIRDSVGFGRVKELEAGRRFVNLGKFK